MTESFAAQFFHDLAGLTDEPVLKSMLERFSREETTHAEFAFDLLATRLRHDPAVGDRILRCAHAFRHVGGYVMPHVAAATDDNLKPIDALNRRVEQLVGRQVERLRLRGGTATMITTDELYILSYYRASELAGALLFGKLAMHTTLDDIRLPMTRHCCEEAQHAWLWSDTIRRLGRTPLKVTRTYQTEYSTEFGMPQNTLEIFCLTQVFERRTMRHFQRHLAVPHLHPAIRETLQTMIEDEVGHLGWIRQELDKHAAVHGSDEIEALMGKLEAIDECVYGRLLNQSPYKEYFGEGAPWNMTSQE